MRIKLTEEQLKTLLGEAKKKKKKKKKDTTLCARGKNAAKAKYDVYPSAYANGYAVQVCKGKIAGLDVTYTKEQIIENVKKKSQETFDLELKKSLESELGKYQKLYKKVLRYKHLPKYQEDIEVLRDKIKDTKNDLEVVDRLDEDLAVWFGTKKKKKGAKQPQGPWVNICRKKKKR
jgi:hypothetical protein